MRIQSQIPSLLIFTTYVSELILVNALFYIFFHEDLTPGATNVLEISPVYGWMSMVLSLAYILGVWIRPIAFYYRSSRRGSITFNVTLAVLVMAITFVGFLFIFDRRGYFSMGNYTIMGVTIHFSMLIPFFCCLLIAISMWRYILRWIIWHLRSMGRNQQHIVFVGSSHNLIELLMEMNSPILGYHVLGYFNNESVPAFQGQIPYLGKVEDVHAYLKQQTVHQLFCSLPSSMSSDIVPIIDSCEHNCCHFYSVPNVRNYLKRTMQMEIVGSVPVLSIREDRLSGSLTNRIIKRTFDLFVSSLFIVTCFWWIYLFVAILTKIFQPGPVFFKQKRSGLSGKEFICYKFRSMKVNNQSDTVQATKNDPRKTKFGEILRKTNIDELPQFINVFKGDMSIVGPRPHMIKHTEEYSALIDRYMVRHWVRPGITGWAQVTGARGETSQLWQMEERIKKDIWYIENWSLMLDIQIIFMTLMNIVKGDKDAY